VLEYDHNSAGFAHI